MSIPRSGKKETTRTIKLRVPLHHDSCIEAIIHD